MDWSPTVDVILYAVPFFVVFIVLGAALLPVSARRLSSGRGYETRDTATSLTMGIGSVVINLGWKLVVLAAYTGLYVIAPVHLSAGNPLAWIALFLLEDLAYYWYHRTHHTVRMLWASHVVTTPAGTTTCPRRCASPGRRSRRCRSGCRWPSSGSRRG